MKWIKANGKDSLPKIKDDYFTRRLYKGEYYKKSMYFDPEDMVQASVWIEMEVEWLDESQSIVNADIRRLSIAFGEFLNKQKYDSDGEGNWTGLDFPFITEEAFEYFLTASESQIEQGLKPEHKCIPIARAQMSEGRDWWLGKITETVKEFPVETHCLHLKTPLKDVVFLCNAGDFQQLSVLCRHALGYAIDESWMKSQLEMTALLNNEQEVAEGGNGASQQQPNSSTGLERSVAENAEAHPER